MLSNIQVPVDATLLFLHWCRDRLLVGAVTLGLAVSSQSPKWEAGQETFCTQHPSQHTWGVSISLPPGWTYVRPMHEALAFFFYFPHSFSFLPPYLMPPFFTLRTVLILEGALYFLGH